MENKEYDIIIVGGGASGLFAASIANKNKLNVCLIEKNKVLGRKLRITGKGRCNLTNNCSQDGFIAHLTKNQKFLYGAYSKFSSKDAIDYFKNIGVDVKVERGNRVFPKTDNANDLVNALINSIKGKNIEIINRKVDSMVLKDKELQGVNVKGKLIKSKNVIIATGGLSYPLTGSTGDGYRFARETNHNIVELKPSLIAIKTKEDWVQEVEGLSLRNIKLKLYKDDKKIYEELGEIVFTNEGISGPLAFKASTLVRDSNKSIYSLKIDLKPAIELDVLDKRILKEFENAKNKEIKTVLKELLPKSIIEPICMLSNINKNKHIYEITKEDRKKIGYKIKNIDFSIEDLDSIERAIVTTGGVSVFDINPKNFESKKVKGLYFIGEVIDVDGLTGGYNLQICWSTAFSAIDYISTLKNNE